MLVGLVNWIVFRRGDEVDEALGFEFNFPVEELSFTTAGSPRTEDPVLPLLHWNRYNVHILYWERKVRPICYLFRFLLT